MSASLKIDLTQVPFSARGSFLAVSQLPAHWQGLPNAAGLYLRTVRHDVQTPLIAQISLPDEEFDAAIEHAGLTLTGASFRVECCFAGPEALLFRGNGSVTLDFLAETGAYDYLYAVEADGHLLWMANCYKNNKQYLIRVEQGTAEPDQCWQESTALYARLRISGAPDFLFEIREIACEWDPLQPPPDFDRSMAETERDYLAFEVGLPESAPCFQELLHQALFINWSSLVRPEGFLKRESMYMSKNWMTNVWSWDHCFNAMALCRDHPSLAWDQWMIMADFQDASGRLPDSVSDTKVIWNYCKPPIHGWALRFMMERMTVTEAQLREAYRFLAGWTEWWFRFRMRDGLFFYNHGNDSGWDNATTFSILPPVATPELQADMIVQMQVLSELARRLGMQEQTDAWSARAAEHREVFLHKCFRNNLPVAIHCETGNIIECESLLPYEILILGGELPRDIRDAVIEVIRSERFLTPFGFATESPASPMYRSDGYWRGPIWAPSTLMLIDGLIRCGEQGLAREVSERFVAMTEKSGFAENYDALTGEGLRDRAYTWTASTAMILVREILSMNR